jgi:hypothetical protein
MPPLSSSVIRHKLLTALLVSCAGLCVTALAVRSRAARVSTTQAQEHAAQQSQAASPRLEAELVVLGPNGFEPVSVTRPAGQFLLAVDNRSGIGDASLRLDREAGERLREVRVPKATPDWNTVVDLTPGTYVLTEADHPSWSCRITITPPGQTR